VDARTAELLSLLAPSHIAALLKAADAYAEGADHATEWGTLPTLTELVEATVWHSVSERQRVRRVIAASIEADQLARQWAELDVDDIRRMVDEGLLSGLVEDDRTWIPLWQLDESGDPIKGVEQIVRAFPASAAALAEWAERAHPDLGGQTPRERLQMGDWHGVVDAASRGLRLA
jgi:hypothetical protein